MTAALRRSHYPQCPLRIRHDQQRGGEDNLGTGRKRTVRAEIEMVCLLDVLGSEHLASNQPDGTYCEVQDAHDHRDLRS
jgi:hypothetical protein